jgi:hypothetical protein
MYMLPLHQVSFISGNELHALLTAHTVTGHVPHFPNAVLYTQEIYEAAKIFYCLCQQCMCGFSPCAAVRLHSACVALW